MEHHAVLEGNELDLCVIAGLDITIVYTYKGVVFSLYFLLKYS